MLIRTGLLADEFYLLAHGEVNGRPLLPDRVAGLGLASALLGELTLAGHITVLDGTVVLLKRDGVRSALTRRLVDSLSAEQPVRPVRDWLEYFGSSAAGSVSKRLVEAGILVPGPARLPFRSVRLVPRDPNSAAVVAATLVTSLIRRQSLDAAAAMLAGLMRATGLDRDHPAWFEVREQPEVRRHLDSQIAAISRPDLAKLLRHTESAFASAVATHRI